MTSDPVPLSPGDILRIERRYVVDGVVSCATTEGRYEGVQVVGSAEHLVLKDPATREVRLYPLHAVSEITLVKGARRRARAPKPPATASPARPTWDPGVA